MSITAVEPVNEIKPEPPAHVAIIMDGNGRWAKARGLARIEGHRRGAETAKQVVKTAGEMGVQYLTLFSFSSENWNRPNDEVRDLMSLLKYYLANSVEELIENGVQLRVIGDFSRLDPDVVDSIRDAERQTSGGTSMVLTMALSYGGRAELVHAARQLAQDVADNKIYPQDIDEDAFAGRLFTNGVPDPDVLIRTSGEQRISNFLLWQLAYTELVFVDAYWPDFGPEMLKDALREYHGRERRWGGS